MKQDITEKLVTTKFEDDRALLEQAAKVAGYSTDHKWNTTRRLMAPPVLALVVHSAGELVTTGWNPFDESGQALELAVQCLPGYTLTYSPEDYAYCNQDTCAAVRRAIVRAVASLSAVPLESGVSAPD